MNSLVSRLDRLLPRSLQVKLILLVTGLLLLLVGLIGALFSDSVENLLRVQIGRKAVEVARSVALNPAIREGLRTGNSRDVQAAAEAIRKATDAEFVVIGDTRGIRLSHPDPKKIGEHFVGGDIDLALKEGKSYASESVGTLGPSLRGIVPVRDDREEIIGFAAVGYLVQDIEAVVREQQWEILRYAAVVVLFGIFGATLIARGLKSVIFGLEPQEIAALFRERNAVIGAIREGIISVDGEGRLTLVNPAARRYLGESPSADLRGRRLTEVCPCADLERSLGEGEPLFDREMTLAGRTMVVNILPFGAAGAGAVASFRPKDELDRLTRQLSQMQEYSELLRAQTHEYTNKLHTIAGLIQIGAHQEALDLIMTESSGYQDLIRTLAEAVPDPVVAGVILGKFNRARELKIDFIFDRQSFLTDLPEHLDRNHLLTILGNLLDNAFDAVRDAPRREVRLFLTDLGPDLLFEVEDSGEGISPNIAATLFEKGVTTKGGTGRGIGLFLVRRALDALRGEITVGRGEIGGALFTAIIPKGVGRELK
ncbi:sensor histidine kinase regulating citrate/malate metabolism [Desulfuromonas soudanensis]|uniref:histidine kinase n=1 Tax=Desulfuromonas soudanensis TaxID=1603606 RepID=A0A0M3QG83_9BACT|nr:sensor histidine kinase [Desulfuromonas soudanensis]ALC17363.1 sensor histidine kinase regulating citrate/malate metabolism [Desulfuromonas soudanensis]